MYRYVSKDERVSQEEFANRMRRNPTECEKSLYTALLSVFLPYKATIQQQVMIGPYIADLCILPAKLVVELDGNTHYSEEAKVYDSHRSAFIGQKGFSVVRFFNDEILLNPFGTAKTILSKCLPLPPSGKDSGVLKLPSYGSPSSFRKPIPMTWRKINNRGY
jgi:very-short-patch-repair endonuclease